MNEKNTAPARADGGLQRKIRSHGVVANAVFRLKASGLSLRRGLRNAWPDRIKRFSRGDALRDEPVISTHEGALWDAHDNPLNWRLTAGKVHNLRTAARMIDGIEIPAGETFSFWAHVGKPTRRRGFVTGRAVREGCIVPTVAGGLCQLSNALYDAALRAGLEIVERHRHSEVIKGSLAEQDRDATIKWNYLDLRFRSPTAVRIEVDLDEKTLAVRLKGKCGAKPQGAWQETIRPASAIRDCYSCGQTRCASHRVVEPVTRPPAAFLLDEMWPEYDAWVGQASAADDVLLCPVDPRILRKRNYGWSLEGRGNVRTASLQTMLRALAVRRTAGRGGRALQSTLIEHDRRLAQRYLSLIPPECTHLVVAQNLLPHVWEAGALGGRSFDVLMYRLPLRALQDRLDDAYSRNRCSSTLNDFRAPDSFVELESRALDRARHIVTPHSEIASMFGQRAVRLAWRLPPAAPGSAAGATRMLLAGPPLGRKGVYEVERLAEELGLPVVAPRGATEGSARSLRIETVDSVPWREIGLVLLPAYVEHRPRIVLKAVAAGIPAVVSEACGLGGVPGVTSVATGDYASLRRAVIDCLRRPSCRAT